MRELKTKPETPILATHYPVRPDRAKKRWIIAKSGSQFIQKRLHNECVEAAYHRIINAVKSHLQQGEVYYDRDLTNDKSDGLFGMHSFVSSSFYWRLDCDLCYDYQITYALCNCPFEAVIRQQMRSYPLDRVATEKVLEPDFATFYENVLTLQGKRFLFTS